MIKSLLEDTFIAALREIKSAALREIKSKHEQKLAVSNKLYYGIMYKK